ncbi:MAG: hypothetical protein EOM31_11320 [Bacteroidia bacterium]|nr:hypothetical protein [Bacteroidia bacterium]
MKKTFFPVLLLFIFLGCREEKITSFMAKPHPNELKNEQTTLKYENYEIQAKIKLVEKQTRSSVESSNVYDLVLTSKNLKNPVITQLVQKFNKDNSFVLIHYVEGLKIATLYFSKENKLYDIEIEENVSSTRALPIKLSKFRECFNSKYSQLKNEYIDFVGEFAADMSLNMLAPAMAATAAADCAGMFTTIGIK